MSRPKGLMLSVFCSEAIFGASTGSALLDSDFEIELMDSLPQVDVDLAGVSR